MSLSINKRYSEITENLNYHDYILFLIKTLNSAKKKMKIPIDSYMCVTIMLTTI